jgi:hypothetical protein
MSAAEVRPMKSPSCVRRSQRDRCFTTDRGYEGFSRVIDIAATGEGLSDK